MFIIATTIITMIDVLVAALHLDPPEHAGADGRHEEEPQDHTPGGGGLVDVIIT